MKLTPSSFAAPLAAAALAMLCLSWFFPAREHKPPRSQVTMVRESVGKPMSRHGQRPTQADGRDVMTATTGSPNKKAAKGAVVSEAMPQTAPAGSFVPGEKLLRFDDRAGMENFLRQAQKKGLPVLSSSEALLMVRIGQSDSAQWRSLLEANPPSAMEDNPYVYSPNLPFDTASRSGDPYTPFLNQTDKWLGFKSDPIRDGQGVTVAVLDSGILPHPALDQSRITHIDMLGAETSDQEGQYLTHGTSVAAIIAANDVHIPGLAANVDLLDIRVLDATGRGDGATVAMAILRAVDGGAQLINMSLGSMVDSHILREAVNYASERGVLIVASTGNDGAQQITYPARYEKVVAVGAVDKESQRLDFSNQGPEVDLMGPGYGVLTAGAGDSIVTFSGTSAAAPVVTGAIALLMSENPQLTPFEAEQLLSDYANDAGAPGHDPAYGNGLLNIGRVENRDDKSNVDLAAVSFYLPNPMLPEDNADVPIIFTVQNRGADKVTNSIATITIGQHQLTTELPPLEPKQSYGVAFPLSRQDLERWESVPVDAVVKIKGKTDSTPDNNTYSASFELRPASTP